MEPVEVPSVPLGDRTRDQFLRGCQAYRQGQYARALAQFTAVVESEPACAEAVYNYGLACANLGNDGLAVQALVKASDLYAAQDSKAGLDQVKQTLAQLAAQPGQAGAVEQTRA
ncbi:MAG TPA: tetratricopeptide repeat protein [Leptolyngbyaceae cyanobacterium M65_K2018_010]|nr:tetratricopeptide repeat protein [Leptolyngbyaceae cyanobacterium M65_K2018_010]